jgi:hypothetical protein
MQQNEFIDWQSGSSPHCLGRRSELFTEITLFPRISHAVAPSPWSGAKVPATAGALPSQAWLHFLGFRSKQPDRAHRCLARFLARANRAIAADKSIALAVIDSSFPSATRCVGEHGLVCEQGRNHEDSRCREPFGRQRLLMRGEDRFHHRHATNRTMVVASADILWRHR